MGWIIFLFWPLILIGMPIQFMIDGFEMLGDGISNGFESIGFFFGDIIESIEEGLFNLFS